MLKFKLMYPKKAVFTQVWENTASLLKVIKSTSFVLYYLKHIQNL